MTTAVGADIEALCSKCGDVWHVVVAKDAKGKIAKVQCKQCSGYHRYRPVHGAPADAKLPSSIRPPRQPKAPREPVARFEKPAVTADLAKAVKPYRASERFEPGERLEHPNFGQGVVETSGQGKVTVFFATGRRVLVQAKDPQSIDLAVARPVGYPKPGGHR